MIRRIFASINSNIRPTQKLQADHTHSHLQVYTTDLLMAKQFRTNVARILCSFPFLICFRRNFSVKLVFVQTKVEGEVSPTGGRRWDLVKINHQGLPSESQAVSSSKAFQKT